MYQEIQTETIWNALNIVCKYELFSYIFKQHALLVFF